MGVPFVSPQTLLIHICFGYALFVIPISVFHPSAVSLETVPPAGSPQTLSCWLWLDKADGKHWPRSEDRKAPLECFFPTPCGRSAKEHSSSQTPQKLQLSLRTGWWHPFFLCLFNGKAKSFLLLLVSWYLDPLFVPYSLLLGWPFISLYIWINGVKLCKLCLLPRPWLTLFLVITFLNKINEFEYSQTTLKT